MLKPMKKKTLAVSITHMVEWLAFVKAKINFVFC